jgi:hypothetical protein
MKIAYQLILTLALAFLGHQVLPFWVMAIAAALASLFFPLGTNSKHFAIGFSAGLILWTSMGIFADTMNASLLSTKIADMFKVKSYHLISLTGFIGAILGGMGALTGHLAKALLFPGRQKIDG